MIMEWNSRSNQSSNISRVRFLGQTLGSRYHACIQFDSEYLEFESPDILLSIFFTNHFRDEICGAILLNIGKRHRRILIRLCIDPIHIGLLGSNNEQISIYDLHVYFLEEMENIFETFRSF